MVHNLELIFHFFFAVTLQIVFITSTILSRISTSYLNISVLEKYKSSWFFFSRIEYRLWNGLYHDERKKESYKNLFAECGPNNTIHKFWEGRMAGWKKNWIYNRKMLGKMSELDEKWCKNKWLQATWNVHVLRKRSLSIVFNSTYVDWSDNHKRAH